MTYREQFAPRRRTGVLLLQLCAAALFLAVIGGSVGFILGSAQRGVGGVQRPGDGQPGGQQVGTQPGPAGGPTATPCPQHTEQLARDQAGSPGTLSQVLHVRTDRSQVWICEDSAGTLFNQGLTGTGDGEFREGDNALFLTDVVPLGAGYRATNVSGGRTTQYDVSTTRLVIRTSSKEQAEPVTSYQ